MSKRTRLFFSVLAFLFIVTSGCVIVFIYLKSNSYNIFIINKPDYIPKEFKKISVVKKIPPEKGWVFITTYENSQRQQINFDAEPHRNIRCWQEQWKKNLKLFRPKNSIDGCSFYMDYLNNNKTETLHWFLWNVDNNTYAIYDQESILTNQEAIDMAQSISPQINIVKDLTLKK